MYASCKKFLPCYPLNRDASIAKQGRSRYSYKAGYTELAPCWAHKTLPVKLGSNYPRRMGEANNHGLQDRIPAEAIPKPQASSNYIYKKRRGMHAGRDPEHARQAGYLTITRQPPGLLLPNVSGAKEVRQAKTCNKLNLSVKTEHFKMEGIHMLKDLLKVGDWMAKINLKDAYFMSSGGQRIPSVPMEGQNIPVQLPAIRSVISSVGLYQDHTSSGGNPAGVGTMCN